MTNFMDDPGNKLMYQWKATGNNEIFGQLYTMYYKDVYKFLLAKGNDSFYAKDLVQGTFLSLFQSKSEFKATSKFTTYLFTIANNRARFLHKTAHRAKRTIANDTYHNLPTMYIDKHQFEIDETIGKPQIQIAMDRIDPLHKRLIESYYIENRSIEDMEVIFDKNSSFITQKLKNAVENFKKQINSKTIEDIPYIEDVKMLPSIKQKRRQRKRAKQKASANITKLPHGRPKGIHTKLNTSKPVVSYIKYKPANEKCPFDKYYIEIRVDKVTTTFGHRATREDAEKIAREQVEKIILERNNNV